MAADFVVDATELNLRSEPDPTKKNRIASLPQGTPVEKLGESAVAGWWEVAVTQAGTRLTGFVNAKFLAKANAKPAVAAVKSVVPAHLRANNPEARRDSANGRAFPISEAGRPPALAGTPAQRAAGLMAIIDWLGVDVGARWARTTSATYCNIYAYDVACLAGVYIPRVWWKAAALAQLEQGKPVAPVYEATVTELNANALTDWFTDHGGRFGWRRSFDLTALQDAANAGKVAVIVARNANVNASGHIQIVAPEHGGFAATRKDGAVTNALVSQAGAKNFRYGQLGASWYASSANFSRHGFWICDA